MIILYVWAIAILGCVNPNAKDVASMEGAHTKTEIVSTPNKEEAPESLIEDLTSTSKPDGEGQNLEKQQSGDINAAKGQEAKVDKDESLPIQITDQKEDNIVSTSASTTEKVAKLEDDLQTTTKNKPDKTSSSISMDVSVETANSKSTSEIAEPKAEAKNEVRLSPTESAPSSTLPIEEMNKAEIAEDPTFTHQSFDKLLSTYVSATGSVNYRGLKQDEAQLDTYLTRISEQDPSSMSKNEGLAFWINVYNAHTIKLILNNFPTASIMDLHGGKAWDHKWININGQTYTLNDIEHKIIRPTYNDARIHFAVNCAAASCPPLLNKAYTARNLDALLEQVTKKFINNSMFNQIQNGKVVLSKIFEWYAGDFGDVIAYINTYSDIKVKAGTKITYNEYDWSLNGK